MPIENVPPVSGPAPATIARAPWSVRRTATIDTTFPGGLKADMHMAGHARDLLTRAVDAEPVVLAEDRFTATVTQRREIVAVSAQPPRAGTAGLAGARAGSQLRTALANTLGEERMAGTPLYLLLDDIAGASLVAPFGYMSWQPDRGMTPQHEAHRDAVHQTMVGVCIGFSPDSPVYVGGPEGRTHHHASVEPLDATDDSFAWHALAATPGPAARRARRIDVRFEGDLILADTHFQDSAPMPDGTRTAVHEYLVSATIDRASMTIRAITADPRILPFGYCPAASLGVDRLVGAAVGDLRDTVIERFARTQGCTHLNDTMRSLAEVPQLASALASAIAAA